MGAYNILFHFNKLYEHFGPLRRRLPNPGEETLISPTPLFVSSACAVIWAGVVLVYLVLHEMGPGHRGSQVLFGFYIKHIVFGIALPLVYSALVNAELWWSRRVVIPVFSVFIGFYLLMVCSAEFRLIVSVLLAIVLLGGGLGWLLYLAFNKSIAHYFSLLRKSQCEVSTTS